MEGVELNSFLDNFSGKKVLVTGHTGFKGAWLTHWLKSLGAYVVGYALDPPTQPSMFDITGAGVGIEDIRADVRDLDRFDEVCSRVQPDFVFHMAAQPLVRLSYREPLETLETNVMGTANVLNCIRKIDKRCAVVVVTSDKCYENINTNLGYRESDAMGGSDPYSMSKGATELLVASWRRSFFGEDSPVLVSSGRAGNVIGGGDWAEDRITTDCVTALCEGRPIGIRNPFATRPWQHVLEPLSGYMWLAAKLYEAEGERYASAWNFGPVPQSVCNVERFAKLLIKHWGSGEIEFQNDPTAVHEAKLLSLSSEKAFHELGWEPTWCLDECLKRTADWYKAWNEGSQELGDLTGSQIRDFEQSAASKKIPWALPAGLGS